MHLPLSSEQKKRFNETAANEQFFKWQGLPYGFHVFFFSAIDTPNDNLPTLFPAEFLPIVFSLLPKELSDMLIGEALNNRLGTKGLSLSEIGHEAARQGMTVNEVAAMPELDSYTYSDGKNMVCSNLVAGIWKAAGLFDGLEINAGEFTPFDLYRIKLFDSDLKVPPHCERADPGQPWC